MKITIQDYVSLDEMYCDWYKCPKCGEENIASKFNYCPDCGEKIEWDILRNDEYDDLNNGVIETYKKYTGIDDPSNDVIHLIIKELRTQSNCGYTECKKAYIKYNGDVTIALAHLKDI